MTVKDNFLEIEEQLQSIRPDDRPTVIAVTKYVTIERAKEAYEAGIRHFGENRIEGFLTKKHELPADAVLHFIGTLQTRKVKDVIHEIDYLHSLDRKSLADEIEKRADAAVRCFVQVNIAEEESKHGLKRDEVIEFIKQLSNYKKIEIVGLMTMAPHIDDETELAAIFSQLRELRGSVQQLAQHNAPCTELSMGMSNDYMIAAAHGATFVRIGTKLVG